MSTDPAAAHKGVPNPKRHAREPPTLAMQLHASIKVADTMPGTAVSIVHAQIAAVPTAQSIEIDWAV